MQSAHRSPTNGAFRIGARTANSGRRAIAVAQRLRVRRRQAVFNVSTGFNDMHFFSHHLHIPTLGYGPGGEDYHAVDERAKVRELLASAKIYAALMTGFAG